MIDVLGFGVAAVDDLVYVDHFPAPDTKQWTRGMQRQGGGLAATALVAAARLGARAAYCARLGDDDLSRYTLAELQREGVDCSRVLFDPDARPFHAVIIVDLAGGTRTILVAGGGGMLVEPHELQADWLAECRVLFFDHYTARLALAALVPARAAGIPIVADIENVDAAGVRELWPQVDHLIVGIQVAARLSGETDPARMVAALAGPRHACLAVTAGERGCWYREAGTAAVHHVPALQVAVVDTTGCGDVFHGAYAAALAAGEEPRRAIRMATVAAGLKTTRPGGRAGIPDRATLDRFLEEHADEDYIVPT